MSPCATSQAVVNVWFGGVDSKEHVVELVLRDDQGVVRLLDQLPDLVQMTLGHLQKSLEVKTSLITPAKNLGNQVVSRRYPLHLWGSMHNICIRSLLPVSVTSQKKVVSGDNTWNKMDHTMWKSLRYFARNGVRNCVLFCSWNNLCLWKAVSRLSLTCFLMASLPPTDSTYILVGRLWNFLSSLSRVGQPWRQAVQLQVKLYFAKPAWRCSKIDINEQTFFFHLISSLQNRKYLWLSVSRWLTCTFRSRSKCWAVCVCREIHSGFRH